MKINCLDHFTVLLSILTIITFRAAKLARSTASASSPWCGCCRAISSRVIWRLSVRVLLFQYLVFSDLSENIFQKCFARSTNFEKIEWVDDIRAFDSWITTHFSRLDFLCCTFQILYLIFLCASHGTIVIRSQPGQPHVDRSRSHLWQGKGTSL